MIKPGVRYQKQFWPDASYDVSTVGGNRLRYAIRQGGSFASRIAVAYDPKGDGRTSIHAAHGRYDDYQVLASAITVRSSMAAPVCARSRCVSRHPSPRGGLPATGFPNHSRRFQASRSVTPELRVPYAMHTALGLDHVIATHVSLAANYIRVRGRHQLGSIDYDPIVPSLGPGGRPNDIDHRAGTSASVLQYTSFGESWYHGLTISLNKRFTGSHQLLASYTLSTAEDTSTDFQTAFLPENHGVGRDPSNPTGLPVGFDPDRERGPATHDQRHRLVVSGLYRFPFGVQVAAIVTVASGRPFSPLAGADLNGDGDGGAFPSDRARRAPPDPASSVGRNSETMPGQATIDARVSKGFTVRGRTQLELLAEAFNLFNRSNFSEVNAIFGRGAYPNEPQRDEQGRVTYGLFEQALPPRQLQLAVRFTF